MSAPTHHCLPAERLEELAREGGGSLTEILRSCDICRRRYLDLLSQRRILARGARPPVVPDLWPGLRERLRRMEGPGTPGKGATRGSGRR